MNPEKIRHWLETKAELSFSRSSGPGGQNVNKVNSKTTLRVDLALIEGISESERARLLDKLGSRLVGGTTGPSGEALPGTELLIQVQDERSQLLNRGLAVERALAVIVKALHRDKPRRATKPSRASQERRVVSKKVVSTHKKNRGRPGVE